MASPFSLGEASFSIGMEIAPLRAAVAIPRAYALRDQVRVANRRQQAEKVPYGSSSLLEGGGPGRK